MQIHSAQHDDQDGGDESDEEDDDLDFVPSREEIEREEEEEPKLMLAARTIDAFLQVMHEQRPFEQDSDDYRKRRAVAAFKAEVELKRLLNQTDVAPRSTISHVGMTEYVRQMVRDGDPNRRSCQVNEAFGAKLKYVMRNLVCRRIAKGKTISCKRRKEGKVTRAEKWTQTFKSGRIKQTFRRMNLYRAIIDDPTYEHLLQRKDVVVAHTGFAVKKTQSLKPEVLDIPSISSKLAEYVPPEQDPNHPLYAGS